MPHSRTHRGFRPYPAGSPITWIWIPVVFLGIITMFALSLPRLRTTESRRGLLHVTLGGWGARVEVATFSYDGHTVALADRFQRLIPERVLPPGVLGSVHLVIQHAPIMNWLPGETQNVVIPVTTPTTPIVAEPQITRSVAPVMTLVFEKPVAMVAYATEHRTATVRLAVPNRRVTVHVDATQPGTIGSITIRTAAVLWESLGPAKTVEWTAPPYLTAASTPKTDISPQTPLTVTFSQPLTHRDLKHWQVVPKTPGSWKEINATTYQYTPNSEFGFGPNALVAITIPGGADGPRTRSGSYLAHTTTLTWATAPGSVLRLQQLLAEEGYLPVSWQPTTTDTHTLSAEISTIYDPPTGTFQWKSENWPEALKSLWSPGNWTVMIKGAIMQFERVNGLTVDGIPGPTVWKTLIDDRLAGQVSPDGYTYIFVTEGLPETMELWDNGQLVLSSDANTGIPQTPTYLGTFPVYERLPFQVMRGHNPNGTPYADPVHWINYFKGGDAVHAFPRASYGFPQSLGCVELPLNIGPIVYHTVHYGTLVTVNPPGVTPAPANSSISS
ncbi:MAG: L,D-transpeptidase family protein [Firmicutes bacterium]|nr:L,D-transpeptidase family protein [Bacillota bacterium]